MTGTRDFIAIRVYLPKNYFRSMQLINENGKHIRKTFAGVLVPHANKSLTATDRGLADAQLRAYVKGKRLCWYRGKRYIVPIIAMLEKEYDVVHGKAWRNV